MSRRSPGLEVKVNIHQILKNNSLYREKQDDRKSILEVNARQLGGDKSLEQIKLIPQMGNVDQRYALGLFYYSKGNFNLAYQQFQAAAAKEVDQYGFKELAKGKLAELHQMGYGFPIQQPAEADKIYNDIIYEEQEKGVAVYPDACFQAAQFYYYGVKGEVEIERALQLYIMAANAGHPNAQVELAEIALFYGLDEKIAITLLNNNKDLPEVKPYLSILENENLQEKSVQLHQKALEIHAERLSRENGNLSNSLKLGYVKILANKLQRIEYAPIDQGELKSELKKIAQNEGQYKINISTPNQKYCLAIYYLQCAQKLKEIASSAWFSNEGDRLDYIQSAIKLLENIEKSASPQWYQSAQCKLAELVQQQPIEKLKFKGSSYAFDIYKQLALDSKDPCPEALFQLGKDYQKSKNNSEAFQYYWWAAQLGHSQALEEWLDIACKDQNPYTREAHLEFATLLVSPATKPANTTPTNKIDLPSQNRHSFHRQPARGIELPQLPSKYEEKPAITVAYDLLMLP